VAACTDEVHIFDVDYTLVKKPSSYYFLREGLREKLISFRQLKQLPFEYLRYKLGFANHDFIEEAVRHFSGLQEERLDELAEHCFTRFMMPDIYCGAFDLIKSLKDSGAKVVLATSSFRTIIEPLARFLRSDETIASGLEFSDGVTTGRLSGNALFGKNKLDAVRFWLSEHNLLPTNVSFYSDSYTDLPLLEYCGHPVAVNPDIFLRNIALKNKWEIRRYKETFGKR
jgi:HAD superfamily hydrolase (TIGR01490 family)